MEQPERGVIESAGGLVWRRSERGPELAAIFLRRHHNWTLPKGHLEAGETWQEAAVREVREETGCEVSLGSFAGAVAYEVQGVPKVVLFWNMRLEGECHFEPSDEVAEMAWMSIPEALEKLGRESERRLLHDLAEQRWPRRYSRAV